MNEQDFKNRIERRWGNHRHRSRRWVGMFFLIVGGLLLARASGVIFPTWFFTWPMFLIGIGLFSGIRHGFRNFAWLIPVVVGGAFLTLNYLSPDPELKRYIWPMAFIALGLLFIFRSKKKRWPHDEAGSVHDPVILDQKTEGENSYRQEAYPDYRAEWHQAMTEEKDVIDATAIFGGVKKNVLSKNFKGGDVTTFMGGAEINLSQADCHGKVMIDCFNMFGGTKFIIPPDWDVQSGLVTIFGGIEDKRQPAKVNPDKVLYLDGTCIFGGVEIKSF